MRKNVVKCFVHGYLLARENFVIQRQGLLEIRVIKISKEHTNLVADS